MHLKKKTWDVAEISNQLRSLHYQINSGWNDGFTARGCKQDLFQLKCLIEDLYQDCPTFIGEEEWEETRTLQLLQRQHK